MNHAGRSAVLPLRPLTAGELLDAAVSLLRAHGRVLLPLAATLALAEQAVLAPVRESAGLHGPTYWPSVDHVGDFWFVLATGFGIEATIIAALGVPAAHAAGAAVVGERLPPARLLRVSGDRIMAALFIALVAGAITALAALGGPLWIIAYGLLGFTIPTLVLDRMGPLRALGRGIGLATRSGFRGFGIRLLGYLAWLAIRLALGIGGVAALDAVGLADRWPSWLGPLAWLVVNTLAYPTLACLDAALHVETRVRTEGLDILLARTGTRRPLDVDLLAVTR